MDWIAGTDLVLGGRKILDTLVVLERLVSAEGIRQHQRMRGIRVCEVVIDALVLHEPLDEVQIGFPILGTVLANPVIPGQRILEIGAAVVAEYLLDDIRNSLLLENAAVGPLAEEPQPGHALRAVAGVTAEASMLLEIRNERVKVT